MFNSVVTPFNRTAQKAIFSIKDSFSKYDQIRRKLKIWSHLLKKPLMENFFFCAVLVTLKSHQLLKLNTNHCLIKETKEQHKRLTT